MKTQQISSTGHHIAGTWSISFCNAIFCCIAMLMVNVSVSYGQCTPPTVSFATTPTNVCSGQPVTITASGGSSYAWSTGGSAATINVAQAAVTSYTITVTGSNGCTISRTYNLAPINSPVIDLTAASTQVCPGQTVTFYVSGADTYTWSDNLGSSPIANTTYSVTGTDGTGCFGTASIDVTMLPTPPVTITQLNFPQCAGNIQLQASGGTSYVWGTGETVADITVAPTAATTYSVTATGQNSCTAEASVTITPAVPYTVAQNVTQPACPSSNNGVIDVTATGTGGPFSYTWSNGSALPAVQSLAPGDYHVTVSDAGGCSTTFDFSLAYISAGNIQVDIVQGDTNAIAGEQLQLTGSVVGSGTLVYTWLPAEGLSCNNCLSPLLTVPNDSTVYHLVAADQSGCVGEDSIRVSVLSEKPLFIPSAFSPNNDGRNDYFQIMGSTIHRKMQGFDLKIFDRWGDEVYRTDNPLFKWDGTYKGAKLAPDVFVYELTFWPVGEPNQQSLKGSLTIIK